jgi:phosphoribosylformylglycinamidine synthase
MFRADVEVMLKPGVLDPQGKAVASSLSALGYSEVADVRVGKVIKLSLTAANKEEAARRVDEMGKRLLANMVIEDFRFTVTEV